MPSGAEDGRTQTRDAGFLFVVVDRLATTAFANQMGAQISERGDGVGRVVRKRAGQLAEQLIANGLFECGETGLAYPVTMSGLTREDRGRLFLWQCASRLAAGEKTNGPGADDGYLRCFPSITTIGAVAPTS